MFCSSLRKRPEWASLPKQLLAIANPKWQEKDLQTHDLQIPVPNPKQRQHVESFNIILMSARHHDPTGATSDSDSDIARVERLYHRYGGRDVGVILLLAEKSILSNGTAAFMEMQEKLSRLDIPIMPLATIQNLQTMLSIFQRQLFNRRSAEASPPTPNPVLTLLSYCSSNAIPEHARNILSDVCHSIPDLAQAATTRDGQAMIRQWLSDSPEVVEDIIGFWEQEFIVN